MSKVVFVGNVPYDMTEEQLIDIFSAVGPVAGFRLVFDRDTGKAKGFGFCEFHDHETAMSAVRNLNGQDVKGRPLRIDLADSDPFLEGKTTTRGELDDLPPSSLPGGKKGSSIPPGVPIPPGSSALDVITGAIARMPPGQMMDVIAHMKSYTREYPDKARELLKGQPQLAYALFQAMLMNQVADPALAQRMLQAQTQAQPAPPPPPPMARPPMPVPTPQPSYPPPAAYGGFPPPPPAMPPFPPPGAQFHPPPPGPSAYGQHAPPPPAQPAQGGGGQVTDEQRKAMLLQVLSLTPQQIEALPPAERATIIQLRQQLGVP